MIFLFQTVFSATEAAKLSHLIEPPQCSSNRPRARWSPPSRGLCAVTGPAHCRPLWTGPKDDESRAV